jgi:hypothetical protein
LVIFASGLLDGIKIKMKLDFMGFKDMREAMETLRAFSGSLISFFRVEFKGRRRRQVKTGKIKCSWQLI